MITYLPTTYRKGLTGLLVSLNRAALGLAVDAVDWLESLGERFIMDAGVSPSTQRLALWGAGVFALFTVSFSAGFLLLGDVL